MAKTSKTTELSQSSSRPIEGIVVGISVANSEDLDQLGYTADDVNRVTIRLSEALLSAGARLVFGHDWRRDGVMNAIACMAAKYRSVGQSNFEPMIHNLLPWPTEPLLDAEVRGDLEQRGLIKVEQVGLPDCQWTSRTDPISRAIALTHLRRELAKRIHARVCIGGKEKSSQGFYAGIIEEAWTAVEHGQPLYVARFLGGASARLVEAIQDPDAARSMDVLRPIAKKKEEKQSAYDAVASTSPSLVPPNDLSKTFDSDDLQRNSGLDAGDWSNLLCASDVDPFAALVIRGLRQARPQDRPPKLKEVEQSKSKTRRANKPPTK